MMALATTRYWRVKKKKTIDWAPTQPPIFWLIIEVIHRQTLIIVSSVLGTEKEIVDGGNAMQFLIDESPCPNCS
jgi:hypothetical protein